MTSDRDFDQTQQRRLVDFTDRVFRGQPAARGGLDQALAEAVSSIKREDRVPPFDRSHMQKRKEELMQFVTATATPGLLPGSEQTILEPNGRIPRPVIEVPSPRISRRRTIQAISFLVLGGLLATIAYGLFDYRGNRNAVIPAVQETQESEAPIGIPWGQFRGGPERTGYTSDPGPGGDLTLRWSFTAEESLNGIMQAEGKVFAYGAEGGLYAINAGTGEQVWAIDLSEGRAGDPGAVALPAVASGTVYVSTLEGILFAVDATSGEIVWQSTLDGAVTSAPTVAGHQIFVITSGQQLHALNVQTGEELWDHELPAAVSGQYPTIVENMYVFPAVSGAVYALDATSGELIWATETFRAHRVAAYKDSRLYVPTVDGRMVALDAASGDIVWQTGSKGNEALNPVVTDSAVIVAVAGTDVQALDPATGHVQWTLDSPTLGGESPHAAGSTLYLNFSRESYSAVDLASGELLETVDTTGAGSTSAISGELLFVSGRSGPIRAFGPVDGEPNEVTGSMPESPAQSTPSADNAVTVSAIEAPAAGEMQADFIFSHEFPEGHTSAGTYEDPDGRLWSLTWGGGAIDIVDRDFNVLHSWDFGKGSGPNQFDWGTVIADYPDITWDFGAIVWLPDGTAHVTNLANARIQVISPDGEMLGSWGAKGDGDGQFQNPVAMVLNADNEFIVADLKRRDIQWFDIDGNFLRRLTGPDSDTPFGRPVDIALDSDGNLWVLDSTSGTLSKFSQDNKLDFSIGDVLDSALPGHFFDPADIDIDEQGNVWVADQWNRRIQVFNPDGHLLAVWDGCGTESGCLMNTGNMVIGGNGFFYITDWDPDGLRPNRMHKFHVTFMPDVPIMIAATPAAEE